MVLVNTPHNPTGHILTSEELDVLERVLTDFPRTLVFSDEVYESYVFENIPFNRVATRLWSKTLTLGSASKLLNLTGWRVGWVFGPSHLISAVATIHQNLSFCAPTPLQYGISEALVSEDFDEELTANSELLAGNAKLLVGALRSLGVDAFMPDGGYFVVANISKLSMTDEEFSLWLAKERKVISVPLCCFFLPQFENVSSNPSSSNLRHSLVRFSICKDRQTIELACERIAKPFVATFS